MILDLTAAEMDLIISALESPPGSAKDLPADHPHRLAWESLRVKLRMEEEQSPDPAGNQIVRVIKAGA